MTDADPSGTIDLPEPMPADTDAEMNREAELPQDEFYSEMVQSYVLLYPDYAAEIVRHAAEYVKPELR